MVDRGMVLRRLPPAPPVVKIAPWFQVTVVRKSQGNLNVTTSLIHQWLFAQLGWTQPVSTDVRYRFQKVRIWTDFQYGATTAVTSMGSIVIKPFSLIGESYDTVCEDWSAEVRYARTGFIWPRAQAITVFTPGSEQGDRVLSIAVSDAQAPWTLYLDLEFSPTTDSASLFSGMSPGVGNCDAVDSLVSDFASLNDIGFDD